MSSEVKTCRPEEDKGRRHPELNAVTSALTSKARNYQVAVVSG
jgi:hypothetical protein